MPDDVDPATTPKRPEMSLGELFSEMTGELSTLFRKEVELAKLEGKEELKQAGAAAGMFAGAGVGGFFALMFAVVGARLAARPGDEHSTGVPDRRRAVGHRGARAALVGEEEGQEGRATPANNANSEGGRAMGQSAEELRRDIERTREGLGETLDAIGDRVSPGRIMERKKNRVTARFARRASA
jgi:hypothetical protein